MAQKSKVRTDAHSKFVIVNGGVYRPQHSRYTVSGYDHAYHMPQGSSSRYAADEVIFVAHIASTCLARVREESGGKAGRYVEIWSLHDAPNGQSAFSGKPSDSARQWDPWFKGKDSVSGLTRNRQGESLDGSPRSQLLGMKKIDLDVIAHEDCPSCRVAVGCTCVTPLGVYARQTHLERHDQFIRTNNAYRASNYGTV